MSAMESRLTPNNMMNRTDWLGAVDGPNGVIWIHVAMTPDRPLGPTEFDSFWTTVKSGIARAQ